MDVNCTQDFRNCPYRILDLKKSISVCNYYSLTSQLIINREFSKIPALTRKACKWIQNEEKRLEFIIEIARKKGLDVLKNAQIGDKVFCQIGPYHEVKLLEKPSGDSIFLKCRTPNGKIIKVQACDLRRISKGVHSREYFIEGVENEKRAEELEYKIKYYGFRTEVEKKDNGFLLRIYGDSQQEVDEFITLALEQDSDISPYI